MKVCVACGMPMNGKDDFAMGAENKDYCKYCARPDGTMQSYEEKLSGMTEFIVRSQNVDSETARNKAKEIMSKLPAWEK